MSLGNVTENDILKLFYNATAIALVADNASSTPLTNVQVSLHTADPGETGDQTTSEAAYTGYGRVAVARTTGGWTVTNNSVSPVAAITFGAHTAGTETLMFASTGQVASGASKIWHRAVIGNVQGPFSGAANDDITIPGHTLAVDDRVTFAPAYDSTLPTGLVEGTVYWVKTSASNVITVSTTQGGGTLDLTAVGDGVAYKVTPIVLVGGSPGTIPVLSTATTFKLD